MAGRTEDWGLPDRGRDAGVCIFLLGESADSLMVGVRGLGSVADGPERGYTRRLAWTRARLCPPTVGATSCRCVCWVVFEALAITLGIGNEMTSELGRWS